MVKSSVIKFINDFKEKYPKELEDLFGNEYNYWFAQMLSARFSGRLYILPVEEHWIVEIEGSFYDITGEVFQYDAVLWAIYMQTNPSEFDDLLKKSIWKNENFI